MKVRESVRIIRTRVGIRDRDRLSLVRTAVSPPVSVKNILFPQVGVCERGVVCVCVCV